MATAHRILALIHIPLGAFALASFWTAIFSRKGGRVHVAAGRWFARAIYGVCATAFGMSMLTLRDPIGVFYPGQKLTAGQIRSSVEQTRSLAFFLMFLTLVSFTTTFHGVQSIRTRKDPLSIRTPFHFGIGVASLISGFAILVYGLTVPGSQAALFYAMSPLGLLIGGLTLHHLARPAREPMAWMYEHIGSMIGGGIAAHTAFAVLGAQRLFDYHLQGWLVIIPWILPSAVGVPALFLTISFHRRKHRRAAP